MQDLNDMLVVLHTVDDVAFEDVSMSAFNFLKGNFSASDTLYVGFRKPFKSVFIGVGTPAGDEAELEAEYWNGSWSPLQVHDETEALSESGLIRWIEPTGQVANTVNGKSLFWVRLSLLTDNPISISGVGPMLCTAEDLTTVNYTLDEEPANILKAMLAARNLMCKELQASPWDILNLPDVTEAATFLSLHNIYANQSDRGDDHYRLLAADYMAEYRTLKAKIAISLDRNDNGKEDEAERTRPGVTILER